MTNKSLFKPLDEPLRHPCHRRPKTRREFLAQGFNAGLGSVIGGSVIGNLIVR